MGQLSLLQFRTRTRFEEWHNGPTIFKGLRGNIQNRTSRLLHDLGFLVPHPTRQMFHALNSVSGSLWHVSRPQPQQQGMWRSSAGGLDPALSPHPSQALPAQYEARLDQNPTRAGSTSTLSHLTPSLLSAQRGRASKVGLQGQVPRATSHPTAGNSRILLHFTGPKISPKYLLLFVILGRGGFLLES